MSAKTYQLRDILMLFEEAKGNMDKAIATIARELEGHVELEKMLEKNKNMYTGNLTYRTMLKALKDSKNQLDIGLFRFGVALSKLEKGAELEEEKTTKGKKGDD